MRENTADMNGSAALTRREEGPCRAGSRRSGYSAERLRDTWGK